MRSGTSFFNGPLFRKNAERFWPVWGSYLVLWLFVLPLPFLTIPGRYHDPFRAADELARQAEYVVRMVADGVVISAIAGVVAAMAVFSYLFASRSAYMLHSMPMDRNTLFFTNYLSGLSFLLLPQLAVFLVTAAVEAMYGCLRLDLLVTWLLAQSGTALFFYSFAVFCAMFTGNLLVLPAFYGILNFLVLVIDTLAAELCSSLLYGFWGSTSAAAQTVVMWLTPAARLMEACQLEMIRVADGWTRGDELSEPWVIAVYAVVALVLTAAALTVYRRRHVESAGDVVAIPIVRPLFKYGVALCAGLCMGVCTQAILGTQRELTLLIFVVLWAVVGYFAAEMLLQKSFRVWKKWKGALALAVLLSVACTAVSMDWFGFETRLPAAGEVESIRLRSMSMGAPYDSGSDASGREITDPKHIALLLDLHQAIIDQRPESPYRTDDEAGDDYIYYNVEYTLKNGSAMQRRYSTIPINAPELTQPGTVAYAAQQLMDDRDFVAQAYGFDELGDLKLISVHVQNLWDEQEGYYGAERQVDATNADLQRLWKAVCADFEAGRIGVRYLIDNSDRRMDNTYTADLYFRWQDPSASYEEETYATAYGMIYIEDEIPTRGMSITLTPQAEQTLSVLEEIGTVSREELHTHAQQRAYENW